MIRRAGGLRLPGLDRLLALCLVAVACGGGASSPTSVPTSSPTSVPTGTASPSASATPGPTVLPSISSTPSPQATPLKFPVLSEVALEPRRPYDSSPPFDIPFTFEVPDSGWFSAHLHAEFFDVMRFDIQGSRSPTRWVAFALPSTILGATSKPATEMGPAEAASLIATNPGVQASETSVFAFAGIEGLQLDLSADAPDTRIFGGPEGNFGLEPAYEARIGFITVDERLLLVLSLASSADLEDAWLDAQPILASVDL